MADFSKQWCEKNDPEMPHDFDILEEADNLKPGHYVSIICEGYGFVAIAKDNTDRILLAFVNSDEHDEIHWVPYNEVVK